MKYGLIGEKLGHSFSAEIHKQLAGYDYELVELSAEELPHFLTQRAFSGINVTIPYKQAVIPYLDWIAPEAEQIGAVNTIVNRGGKLYGYNTDFLGMREMLLAAGIDPKGRKAAVLGTGGTSKTASAVLKSLGAKTVLAVSRSKKAGAITYEQLYREHADTEIVINTTPCGMYPAIEGCPIEIDRLSGLLSVSDAIYNPLRSSLVLSCRQRGIPAAGGLFMLVSQAAYAAGLFTGSDYTKEIARVYYELLAQKQNLVLIGMPGSGKTTIGRLAAQRLGRQFIDTDAEIEKKAGIPIPEYFAEYGEPAFRDLESEIIGSLARQTGCVIATGGGAVLREENAQALAKNGLILFLDCPLADLVATDNRPLARNAEMLKQRFRERMPIYRRIADRILPVTRDADRNADAVIRELKAGGEI